MLIAIDIDGTISYRNAPIFKRICNEKLKFGIDDDRLERLSMTELLEQPEVQLYRDAVGKERFDREIAWIDFHPQVLVEAIPFDGAVDGVKKLAAFASGVTFYTARFSSEAPERSKSMAESTYQWLAAHQFACHDSVVFCDGLKDKIPRLVNHIKANDTDVWLIEDQYERVITCIAALEEAERDMLLRRLTLIAFKAKEAPTGCPGLRVLPLPTWRAIDTLFVDTQEGDCDEKPFECVTSGPKAT